MEGKTHVVGAVALGLHVSVLTNTDPLLMIGAATLGGLFPDICHPNSTIGRQFKHISKVIAAVFGHRTFTHSLLLLVLISWLFRHTPLPYSIELGFIVGMISHYALDALTKQGIRFFYPFKVRVRTPITITTGGLMEKVVLMLLFAYGAWSAYQLIL